MSAEKALGHINFLLDILDEADRQTGQSATTTNAVNEGKLLTSVDDVKVGMTVRVTSNIETLNSEWNECGLGSHNELAAFLNQIGKVTEIEEDDDTLQLTWENYDTCWIPLRACSDANGAKPTLPGMANSWLGDSKAEPEQVKEAKANSESETLFEGVEDDGVKVGNMVRVTNNKDILEKAWTEAELGANDTKDTYCGTIGKILEIEEDDDTVQLQWGNFDTVWIPVKACMDANGEAATMPGMTVSWLG